MTKKRIQSIEQLLNLLFIIIGLIINYLFFDFNIYILLIVLVLGVLLSNMIVLFLPYKEIKTKHRKVKAKKIINNINRKKTPRNRLLTDDEILKLSLEKLSWREFERLCFLYYRAKGFKPRETTEGADGGIDLIVYDREHKTDVAVQIKHYINSNRKITVKDIRELNSSKRNYDCILADFITTSTFSKNALIEADQFKIYTRDINWVKNNIDKWRFK